MKLLPARCPRLTWYLLLAAVPLACRNERVENGARKDLILKVAAEPPQRKTLDITTTQPGRIVAEREAPLHARIPGYVEEVLVDIGDTVKKDQVLVRLSVPELHQELAQAKAEKRQRAAEVKLAAARVVVAEEAVKAAQAHVEEAGAAISKAEGDRARWISEHARIKQLVAGGSLSTKVVEETLQQLRAAEAAREQTAAKVQTAKAELARNQALVTQAAADQEAARAKEEVAQAGVDRLQALVGFAEIRAPFPGRIVRRQTEKGHFVGPAQAGKPPLLVLQQADKVRLQIEIPEGEAPLVDIGDPVAFTIPALPSFRADGIQDPKGPKVSRISWGLADTSRTLRAEIDLANADGIFRPGMYASVTILLEKRRDVPVLPQAAIVTREGRPCCFLLRDGKATVQELKLGLRTENEVEIAAGLDGSEKVIRSSLSSLQPNQLVQMLEEKK